MDISTTEKKKEAFFQLCFRRSFAQHLIRKRVRCKSGHLEVEHPIAVRRVVLSFGSFFHLCVIPGYCSSPGYGAHEIYRYLPHYHVQTKELTYQTRSSLGP